MFCEICTRTVSAQAASRPLFAQSVFCVVYDWFEPICLRKKTFSSPALELQNESPNTRVRVVLNEFRVRLFSLFDDFLAVLFFRGGARLLR